MDSVLSLRGARRARLVVAVAGVAAAAVAGIALAMNPPAASSEVDPTDRWVASADAARAAGPLTFPVTAPDDLINVSFWPTTDVGPIGLFSASGEPTVAVCAAPLASCRQVMAVQSVITARPEGPSVVVVPGEPTTATLSADARRSWKSVALTTATPEWFPR